MAHNLFDERFGDARQPAWHGLGTVFDTELSATAAYKRIGRYDVRLAKAVADGVPLGRNAILRAPTTDDPETRVFGVVGEDYELITPDDVCSIYDEHVAKPIETIGALGHGETFFLSTYLPTVDVKGDEVENYLLISSPMTGLASAEVRVTPVRVVCQNTLIASEAMAVQKLRIVHNAQAKQRMAEWVQETYAFAETAAQTLRDLFEVMASARVKSSEAQKLFDYAYPFPAKPKLTATQAVMEQRIRWWDENVSLMQRRREGAKSLFEGMGTGMDSPAAKGTLWGAYNAVVETEDYRRTSREDSWASSAMFGERAKAKKRAFDYAVGEVS